MNFEAQERNILFLMVLLLTEVTKKRRVMLLLSLILVACKKDEVECARSVAWEEGQAIFVEKTNDWNLGDIQATGTRISAVDFDGDGWTDLFIRKDGSADDFTSGTRSSWLLRNTGAGSFEDVTESSGIRTARNSDLGRPGQVVAFGDVDNDGDLDVYTGYNVGETSVETSELLLNDGSGKFTLTSEDNLVRETMVDQPSGASFVDIDHDGNLDLWLAQASSEQDRLFKGLGNGDFTDITSDYSLITKPWSAVADLNQGLSHSNAWSALACDLNNDGYSELLAASYGRAPNHLWLSSGGSDFSNESVVSGYAFDENQNWSDNESARCWCLWNPTDDDCDGVLEPELTACNSDEGLRWDHRYDREPFRLGGNSGTTICADLNNDGWMDLLTTEIVHWDVGASSDGSEILINMKDSDVVFERPGNESTGLTRTHDIVAWNDGDITGTVFDFDNDGRKDLYIGSTDYPGARGLLYHQNEAGNFSAVPLDKGIDHTRSHGVAIADFDRDGDLDMVIGHSSGRCDDDCPDSFHARLYENQLGSGNFLQVELQGTTSNAAAIGARVEVTTEDGVTQVQEVGGGYGHYGAQNDLALHFGLDGACEAEVKVHWPDSGNTTDSYSILAGSRYILKQEGESIAQD